MASRAEPVAEARTPAGGPFRLAVTDFYFDSLRLVRANLVWAGGLILAVVVGIGWPFGGLVLLCALALPTAAVFRTAGDIVRPDTVAGQHELRWAFGRPAGRLLLVGLSFVIAVTVCAWNVVGGLASGGPYGWAFATLAAWGLVASWCLAVVVWPVLVDPERPDRPLTDDLTLALQGIFTEPRRMVRLALVTGLIVIVSVVLTAAILTVSVAFVALLGCRTVYPIVDRLEAQSAVPVGPTG
ncbi:MAG: hypothetical protein ACJ77W_08500 [Chloroflexota bacterium]